MILEDFPANFLPNSQTFANLFKPTQENLRITEYVNNQTEVGTAAALIFLKLSYLFSSLSYGLTRTSSRHNLQNEIVSRI